jgi:hypothetical protein
MARKWSRAELAELSVLKLVASGIDVQEMTRGSRWARSRMLRRALAAISAVCEEAGWSGADAAAAEPSRKKSRRHAERAVRLSR